MLDFKLIVNGTPEAVAEKEVRYLEAFLRNLNVKSFLIVLYQRDVT